MLMNREEQRINIRPWPRGASEKFSSNDFREGEGDALFQEFLLDRDIRTEANDPNLDAVTHDGFVLNDLCGILWWHSDGIFASYADQQGSACDFTVAPWDGGPQGLEVRVYEIDGNLRGRP